MLIQEIEYRNTNSFSKLLVNYTGNGEEFRKLINNFPDINSFENQINLKSKNYNNKFRKVLIDVISNNYNDEYLSNIQKDNISKLRLKNTFTVTTGHQLNLLTGPIYFIYKIITVINLCEKLKKKYPKYNFIPIYWLASEDHDFEEINHFFTNDKKFKWNTNQSGAVGEFDLKSIKNVIEDYTKQIKNSTFYDDLVKIIDKAYLSSRNLSEATISIVNNLFGFYGLLSIDANNRKLKSIFCEILKKELEYNIVDDHSKLSITNLKKSGYKIQANPRKINLFYLKDKKRERILNDGNIFLTKSGEMSWSLNQIKKEVDNYPERFSPNVLFRPLFQEFILPNICYIGGPSEVAYWLELKSVFDSQGITYPIILNRNSVLIIEKKITKFLTKNKIDIELLFESEKFIKYTLLKKYSNLKLDFTELKGQLKKQFLDLKKLSEKTDKSFIGALIAQEKKQINGLNKLEKRLKKAELKIHSDKIDKIIKIRNKIYFDGKPQERIINFTEFYKLHGPNFVKLLKDNLDPLNKKFSIIEL